ncbi:MAG: universal stress protein [Pirellulales bacterium]
MAIFKHILVPVDFTDANEAALSVALELATQNGSRLTLLHVIERVDQAEDEEMQKFNRMLLENAQQQLAGMTGPFDEAGVSVEKVVVYGRRGGEIVRYSQDSGVDLLVLSSHKVNLEEERPEWGTLSHQISIVCQCPVLLVKR